jgi:phage gp46-like protein
MAQNWDIDPKTGDYVMEGGAPKQTDSLKIAAYVRLKTPRTQWLYAPNTRYGSDFYLLQKRQTTRDASQVEAVAANALQPIADDGRARSIEVEAVVATRHGVGLETRIEEANGRIDNLLLPSLGV